MTTRSIPQVLFLLLVPVVIAEFLTGSTPLPNIVLNLPTLPTLLGLYGCGALLVRELVVRWRKGLPSLLALGSAYGVIEEGLAVKSWFNPQWAALGPLSSYGRFWGVNWVWALELTIFHAVFSISIPVVLLGLVFPQSKGERWLGRRAGALVGVAFLGTVALGALLFPYTPALPQYALAVLLVVAFVAGARILPSSLWRDSAVSATGATRLFATAFLATASFFAIFWVVPTLGPPPIFDALLALLLCAVVARFLARRAFGALQSLSLVSGALGFLILVAFLGLDLPAGTPFIGVLVIVLLFAVRRRILSNSSRGSSVSPAKTPEGAFSS